VTSLIVATVIKKITTYQIPAAFLAVSVFQAAKKNIPAKVARTTSFLLPSGTRLAAV
jgi:hypothetical protein